MDPNTGEVLAMANYPSFDPNKYSEVEMEVFKNAAIQNLYEPGSVFKPLTMGAALNEGDVTPQTSYVDTGEVKKGGYTIHNYDEQVWGETTMTEVIERSINTERCSLKNSWVTRIFCATWKSSAFLKKRGLI